MRDKKLELEIYNYIKTNEENHIDIVNILAQFNKVSHEKIVNAVSCLRQLGYIRKEDITVLYYRYRILKPYIEDKIENNKNINYGYS